MARRVNRDDLEKAHELGVHVPTRTIFYAGAIDEEGVSAFTRSLHILDSTSSDPIHVQLTTEGGDVQSGLAAYDAIVACRAHVTILCVGGVESMGGVVLQAADWRVARPNSLIMLHGGTTSLPETPTAESLRAFRHGVKLEAAVAKIVIDRVRKVQPRYSKRLYEKDMAKGLYLTADEAFAKGLIDEVLQPK